jgi:hypothetical protein
LKPEEREFLKRGFRFDPEEKIWMAPLDEKSIYKAPEFYDTTSPLSKRDHMANCLNAMLLQFWMYGRERFEHFRNDELPRYLAILEDHAEYAGITNTLGPVMDYVAIREKYYTGKYSEPLL